MLPNLWANVALFLLIGYSTFGRAFAYLGVPSLKLFVGDLALASFLALQGGAVVKMLMTAMIRSSALAPFAWTLVAFVGYGLLEVLHGLYVGYPTLVALQNVVFNIYPLFFFLGLAAGVRKPHLLRSAIKFLAWWNLFYGLAYTLYLEKIPLMIPGTETRIFTEAGATMLVVLGLLSFEGKLGWYWIPFIGNAFMILSVQIRAQWVSLVITFLLWQALSKQFSKGMAIVSVFVGMLAIGYITDFSIPAPADRGGTVSTREIIGRAIASVNPELARDYTVNAYTYSGTVSWRTKWWEQIWNSVNADPVTATFGHGYGYPLSELVPYLRGMEIRTPHNVFFYALGYSGWLGVVLFFGFQAAVVGLLYRVFRLTNNGFGLLIWTTAITAAFFGNLFESPSGAIPLYILLGLSASPLLGAVTAGSGECVRVAADSWEMPLEVTTRPYAESVRVGR